MSLAKNTAPLDFKTSGADAIHPNPLLAKKLSAIYKLHRRDYDFRLEDTPYNDLLEALGDPHLNLPPVIHVAGTNGKGSTIAMLQAIFEAAGKHVHTYTSPHLIKFNERIVLANEMISDQILFNYLDIVDQANEGRPVTFFEYTTALAFKAFADTPADICLLEVGLGGRLDCTNIIKDSLVSVIAQIGYDHTEFLGETIEEIASEKAGIIKQAGKFVLAPQNYGTVEPVIREIAIKRNAEFYSANDQYPEGFPAPSLVGIHQLENARTVLKVMDLVAEEFGLTEKNIKAGLSNIKWPARMQNITDQIASKIKVTDSTELWLDSGHNGAGAVAIKKQIETWRSQDNLPLYLVVGMQKSKSANDFMAPLLPLPKQVIFVDNLLANFPQSAEELKAQVKNIDKQADILCLSDPVKAIEHIMRTEPKPCRVLIAGSVYLAGAVLKEIAA